MKGSITKSKAVQNRINDLRSKGYGYKKIARTLSGEGSKMSFMKVKRYLDRIGSTKEAVVSGDLDMNEYVKDRILDTGEALRKVNDILWELMEGTKVSKIFRLSVLKQITSTIKLADELMREFKGLNIKQGANSQIQIIQIAVDRLNELEERGDIKILNPKLKRIKEVEGNVRDGQADSAKVQQTSNGKGKDNDRVRSDDDKGTVQEPVPNKTKTGDRAEECGRIGNEPVEGAGQDPGDGRAEKTGGDDDQSGKAEDKDGIDRRPEDQPSPTGEGRGKPEVDERDGAPVEKGR